MRARTRICPPRKALWLLLPLAGGCTAESTTLPCKDGFSLSNDETGAYDSTSASLTIELSQDAAITYQAVDDSGASDAGATGYTFRMQPQEKRFNVIEKGSATLVSFGRWEMRANSDSVDLDIYSCDHGGKMIDRDFPQLPPLLSTTRLGCQADDLEVHAADHRSATGILQRSLEGHFFLRAKGPTISLDVVTLAHPAESSVSSETCVVEP